MACSESTIVEPQVDNEYYKYESLVSKNRVNVAKALSNSLRDNSSLMDAIKEECNLKFDGDRNVLLRSLSNNNIVELSIYDETAVTRTSVELDEILESDSLLQVYYYQGNNSDEVQGIVVLPDEFEEREDIDLLVVSMDGEVEYINSQIAPDENYFVISENERVMSTNSVLLPTTNIDSKNMNIIAARFTSIEAKRMAESWAKGEPEMRVDILMPYYLSSTNTYETRLASYKYVNEGWTSYNAGTASYYVTWNETVIPSPVWDPETEPSGRCIVYTEEDGKTTTTTLSDTFTDANTGISMTASSSVTSTEDDYECFRTWVYYNEPSGIRYVVLMEFNLQFTNNYSLPEILL